MADSNLSTQPAIKKEKKTQDTVAAATEKLFLGGLPPRSAVTVRNLIV